MKFFVPKPHAKSKAEAGDSVQCMRSFAQEKTGLKITDRKVYRIEFTRKGDQYEACVGEPEYDSGETVMAILDARGKYLICTPGHGGYRGWPIVVRKRATVAAEVFED